MFKDHSPFAIGRAFEREFSLSGRDRYRDGVPLGACCAYLSRSCWIMRLGLRDACFKQVVKELLQCPECIHRQRPAREGKVNPRKF